MSKPIDPIQVAEEGMIPLGLVLAIMLPVAASFNQAMAGLPITVWENLMYTPAGFTIGFFGYPILLKIHFWRQDKL